MNTEDISFKNRTLIATLASMKGAPVCFVERTTSNFEEFQMLMSEFESNNELEFYLRFLIRHIGRLP